MGEPRDPQPPPGTQREAIPRPARLSPVQQTRRDYEHHAGTCDRCRDIDRTRCADGDQLYRTWLDACDRAYEALNSHLG